MFWRLPRILAGLVVLVLLGLSLKGLAVAEKEAAALPAVRLAAWLDSLSRWRQGELANLSFSLTDHRLGLALRFIDLGIRWRPADVNDGNSGTSWYAAGRFRATGADWRLTGNLELEFEPRKTFARAGAGGADNTGWTVHTRLMLADLAGSLPGGVMLEQWQVAAEVSGRLPPIPNDVARLTVSVGGGPLLVGSRFLDLSGQTMTADIGIRGLEADLATSRPRFSGRIAAAPLWAGSIAGERHEQSWRLILDGEPQSLGALVALLLEPANPALPLTVTGSHTCRLEAVIDTDAIRCTAGELRLEVNEALVKSVDLVLSDAEITIPLAHWSRRFAAKGFRREAPAAVGRLHIGRLEAPLVAVHDQDMKLQWAGQTVSSDDSFFLVGAGLPVTVDGLKGEFGGSEPAKRRLAARLVIAPATGGLPPALLSLVPETAIPVLESACRSLKGNLKLELDGSGMFTAAGTLEADLFGGRLTLEDPFARRLFSSSRVIGAKCLAARGVDLDQITALVPVGRATGIIDIELDDFAFAYGQPTRFDLTVNSVPRRGVSQTISVEAIENLSMLSSGGAGMGGVLQTGINRFFSHYRYRAIGLRCSLRGDVFRLNGTIHDGGREYIVRRGLIFGVDVVNHNPDNRISFRDMQERIARVFADREATTGSP